MTSRRDQIWEERRRARQASRGPAAAPPPPKVVPDTGGPLLAASVQPRPAPEVVEDLPAAAPPVGPPSSDLADAFVREELARRSSRHPAEEGGSAAASVGAEDSSHPMFEDMVAAEMRKMEREFQQQLRADEQPPPPLSNNLLRSSPPQGLSQSSSYTGSRLGLSPPPASRTSGAGRRGISSLYNDPRSAAEEQLHQVQSRRGFGQGIHSLYESPDDARLARQKQQAYAKALSEQMPERGNPYLVRGASSPPRERGRLDEKENGTRWKSSPPRGGGPGGGAEYTGLLIGASSSPGRRRRSNPGLEHMYSDPEVMHHKIMDQREYARALSQQMAEKQQRRQQEKGFSSSPPGRRASTLLSSTTAGLSPYRRSLMDSVSPQRGSKTAAASPSDAGGPLPGYHRSGGPQPSPAEKKAAYAAALKQQIMENEERRRKEKELRRLEMTDSTPARAPAPGLQSPSSAAPRRYLGSEWQQGGGAADQRYNDAPLSYSPRRTIDFTPTAADLHPNTTTPSPQAPPPAMTEARRRLVRDVYGSNTSPWATMPAAPYPSPVVNPGGGGGGALAGSPMPPPPKFSASLPSPLVASFLEQQQQLGSPAVPVKASFVKHGALAYDPNVQQTLMAKHVQALELREALEKQMAEKRRVKETLLAKQKREEENEVRRMLEDTERAAAELENDRRRKLEAEQKVQLEAQQDHRRREAEELKLELAHLQQQRAALEGTGALHIPPPPPPHHAAAAAGGPPSTGRRNGPSGGEAFHHLYNHNEKQPLSDYGSGGDDRETQEETELWGNLKGRSPQRRQSVFQQQQPNRRRAATGDRRGEESMTWAQQQAVAEQKDTMRSRSVPAQTTYLQRGLDDGGEDPLEQSLATESRFISLNEDPSERHSNVAPHVTRQFPSVANTLSNGAVGSRSPHRSPFRRSALHRRTAGGEEDEMDVFVEQWQRNHGLMALNRHPPQQTSSTWRSRARMGQNGYHWPGEERRSRRGGVEDSLSSDSTFMMMSEEERQRAEHEVQRAQTDWLDQQNHVEKKGEDGEEERVAAVGAASGGAVSPLTQLLRNHQELQVDQNALGDLRKMKDGDAAPDSVDVQPALSNSNDSGEGNMMLLPPRSPGDEYASEAFEDDDDHNNYHGDNHKANQNDKGVLGDISGRVANVVGQQPEGDSDVKKTPPRSGDGGARGKWNVPTTEAERARVLEAIR